MSFKSRARVVFLLVPLLILVFLAVTVSRDFSVKSAIESGFPDSNDIVSAEICIVNDDGTNEYFVVLDQESTSELVDVISKLNPSGERVSADELEPQTGWPWRQFLISMQNGEEHEIKDAGKHVLIDGSYAWKADELALAKLSKLYRTLLLRYRN